MPRDYSPAHPASLFDVGRRLLYFGGLASLAFLGMYFIDRDAIQYLVFSEHIYLRFWPERLALATHVFSATMALFVAPLQFVPAIRRRFPRLHRTIGWTYVIGSFISAPAILKLTLAAPCAPCRPAFLTWWFAWTIVTILAVTMAVRRNLKAHEQFMIRSYVLMLGFVFVRLETYLELPLGAATGHARAATVLWLAWVVPYVITEIWLTWIPLVTRNSGTRRRADVVGA